MYEMKKVPNRQLIFISIKDLVRYERIIQREIEERACEINELLPWGLALDTTEIKDIEQKLGMSITHLEHRAIAPLQHYFTNRKSIIIHQGINSYVINNRPILDFYTTHDINMNSDFYNIHK